MSKYKVGDEVIYSGLKNPRWPQYKGERGVIISGYPSMDDMYCVRLSDASELSGVAAENLTLMEKTMDNLEVGDVLIDEGGDERTVLAVIDQVVALSGWLSDEQDMFSRWHSVAGLKANDFKLKTEAEEPQEMTVADVEKLVGKKVKIIRDKK